jgi:hypothetical protein
VAIVGSVGQPRDRNPAAAYTLFDSELRQIEFCRVRYDAGPPRENPQRRAAGSLAVRVEAGI